MDFERIIFSEKNYTHCENFSRRVFFIFKNYFVYEEKIFSAGLNPSFILIIGSKSHDFVVGVSYDEI